MNQPVEPGRPEPPHRGGRLSHQIAAGMTASAFVLLLFVLTLMFDKAQDRRRNPNQSAVAIVAGGAEQLDLVANRDGHYIASGRINGVEAVFILDTGATTIAVPEDLADRAGLQRGPEVQVSTANGRTQAWLTRLDDLELGGFRFRDATGTINPGLKGNEVLLGMSVLGSFEIVQRGRTLTLRRPQPET